ETLRLRGSLYWHCLAGQTAFPVQTAVKFKIPLIIWGAHQGIDQVGMFSHLDEVEMTRKHRKDHDLMRLEAEDLLAQSPSLTPADTEPYLYPHDRELEATGCRGIYLNNYFRWDSKAQHEAMIAAHGFEPLVQQRTFDTYNDVDCFHYSGLHDYTKFLKWGYGKVTDHATREIRLKRHTREAGIALVEKYAGAEPRDLGLFLDWVGMTREAFFEAVDAHRDPRIWSRQGGEWRLQDSVTRHAADSGVDSQRLGVQEACEFEQTARKPAPHSDRYMLLGRGWV
ncbi:N-acetyl sugar amidotransferase, partial [bacterium]|nr:N-acetyl sugar amidotransferase [bacterium]